MTLALPPHAGLPPAAAVIATLAYYLQPPGGIRGRGKWRAHRAERTTSRGRPAIAMHCTTDHGKRFTAVLALVEITPEENPR